MTLTTENCAWIIPVIETYMKYIIFKKINNRDYKLIDLSVNN